MVKYWKLQKGDSYCASGSSPPLPKTGIFHPPSKLPTLGVKNLGSPLTFFFLDWWNFLREGFLIRELYWLEKTDWQALFAWQSKVFEKEDKWFLIHSKLFLGTLLAFPLPPLGDMVNIRNLGSPSEVFPFLPLKTVLPALSKIFPKFFPTLNSGKDTLCYSNCVCIKGIL